MSKRILSKHISRRGINAGIGAALISPALTGVRAFAQGGEPIKIGFGMALTGPLAVNGQAGPARRHRSGRKKSTPRAACSAVRSS